MKLLEHLVVTILVLSLMGCAGAAPPDGVLYALQPGSTMAGIRAAMQAAPHTQIMVKDSVYMFAWPLDNGWAFATIGKNITAQEFFQMTGGKGQMANNKTISDLAKFLANNGWKSIPASAVPVALREAFGVAVAEVSTALASAGVTLVSFMVMPVVPGAFPTKVIQ